MGEIQKFSFNDTSVNCNVLSDEPWFRAQDFATIFDYHVTKKVVANNVDDDEKEIGRFSGP